MADKFTMKLEGLQELEAALKELPKATGKNCIRRAIWQAGSAIITSAQNLIRVRRVQPAIAASRIKFNTGAAGKAAFAAAMASGATREDAGAAAHAANAAAVSESGGAITTSGVMAIGPTTRAFYGFEFGTFQQPPHPFMRPAWEANKVQAAEMIATVLKEEIEKARVRIANKQARLLAKANQT
jgi:HK97 gp10 family phage protein